VKNIDKEYSCWNICPDCHGQGKKSIRSRKKVKLRYQRAMENLEMGQGAESANLRLKSNLQPCATCNASGIVAATKFPEADTVNFPHLAIIGGGIGGVALAVACLHRGIPFTLYERDTSFDARSQGYGLTLQQASRAMKGFGITSLADGVYSTNHVVHTTDGKVISEWGMRNRLVDANASPKRTNVHIARQSLRLALLNQLGEGHALRWGHQLTGIKYTANSGVELSFQVNGQTKVEKADAVVGADGIRSVVRELLIGENKTPLRYLGCLVILGICPLAALEGVESHLLDSATVFQTVNGNDRMYMMPYSSNAVMWQFSFPISELEAKALSAKGPQALKEEACRRAQWHTPVPQILAATSVEQISGYPAYDRALLDAKFLEGFGPITLIGDAAHPMSPFKGQGANQALLDALALARGIFKECNPYSNWRALGIRKSVLVQFEAEMLERSAAKVQDSAEAVELLHSNAVLREGNETRGRSLKRKDV
jgi:salicylate hydroxylase